MDSAEMKKLRYQAAKFGVKFNRVKFTDGTCYKFFTVADFESVASINGIDCSGGLSLDEVKNIIAALIADKKKNTFEHFTISI